MKRQNPTDPNLFWCPKCQTYKARGRYYKNKHSFCGIAPYCKECLLKYRNEPAHRIKAYEGRERYLTKNPSKEQGYSKKHYLLHRRERTAYARAQSQKAVATISDKYIGDHLIRDGIAVSQQTIELKRDQLMIHREIKQLKGELTNGAA